jgi:hypothetical protein
MSILAFAISPDAAVPALQALSGAARPLIGLGIFAALLVLFKPLIAGMLRAVLLVISPRKGLAERKADDKVRSALALNRMARELSATHPSLAAELRSFAARD